MGGGDSYTADFNGDGLRDIATFSGSNIWVNRYRTSLTSRMDWLTNGYGTKTTLTYDSISQCGGTTLPLERKVLRVLDTDDGNGVTSKTTYGYEGCYYHQWEDEFRGFNAVTVTEPAGPEGERKITKTLFHQGDDLAPGQNDPSAQVGLTKGKPYSVEVMDAQGQIYSKTKLTYKEDTDDQAPYFTPRSVEEKSVCDGDACGLHSKTEFIYDAFGNVTHEYRHGDVKDHTLVRSFYYNQDKWIVSLPERESIYAGIGTSDKKAETSYYYDDPKEPIYCTGPSPDGQIPTKGNLTRINYWLTNPDGTDPIDPVVVFGYDSFGNRTCTRDARYAVTMMSYDKSKTFRTSVINPMAHNKTIEYYGVEGYGTIGGLWGQVKRVTDPSGNYTQMVYDRLGRLILKNTPSTTTQTHGSEFIEYLDFGTALQRVATYKAETGSSVVCAQGYSYVPAQNICQKSPECPTGTYNVATDKCESASTAIPPTCSSGGRLDLNLDLCLASVIPLDSLDKYLWSETYLDGLGRPTKSRTEGSNGKVAVTETQYDERGLVAKTSLPYFEGTETPKWSSFAYDVVGRVVKVDNPDATSVQTCTNDGVTVQVDASGNRKRFTRDVFGNILKVQEFLGTHTTCTTDEGNPYATTSYEYDHLGNLLTVTDAKGFTRSMTYDTMGRKATMTDPSMGTWLYEYDNNGNLTAQTDARLKKTQFKYDSINRLIKKDYPSDADVQYFYDNWPNKINSNGRLTGMTDASGTTDIRYEDVSGKKVRVTKTLLGNNAPSYSITTELDELGRIRSITYPDGEIVGYAYDDGGNLWKAGGYATFTDYSADGRVGKVIHGNKVTTEYDYIQANNRLWSIKTTAPAGQQLLHKEYSYFGNGNMENIIDYRNAARSQSFTYDGLDRLKTSSAGSDSTTYGYDEIGNLIKNGNLILTPDTTRPQAVSSTYTKAEGSPDPTAVTTTGGQPMIIMVFLGDGFYPIPINQVGNNTIPANGLDRRTYSYDANGNMLSDGLRTFTWNENNLPSSITADGSTTSFVYDGFGQRVKKTGFSGSKIYINQLYEIANGGGVKYIYANGSRLALKTSMPAPLDVTYYHPDHLGSTVLVTNSNGQEIEDVFYEPFGEKAGGSGTVEMSHRFTGQALDEETDLYYYNARYYNPEIGRFISPDPFVPHLFNPQSLNRFSYVMNNPVNRVDPSGYADVTLTNSSGGGGSISVEPITVINLGDIPQNGRTSGGATAPTAVAAPLEGFGGNRVVYVQNNPVNWIDPTGLAPILPTLPPKKPGDGCGDEKTDCIVPDLYPGACKAHDECYSTPGKTKAQCDNEFFWNMFVESGPSPNVMVPAFYWAAVRFWGGSAFVRAQGAAR